MISIRVNGTGHAVDVDEDTPLLWVLRDTLKLTGTKFGCGLGICGACSVMIDGTLTRSCQAPIGDLADAEITTIEGLSADRGHPVQRAWIAAQVPQCGYCQSGQILAAAALLADTPAPTDDEIDDAMSNICRCATYLRIRRAIHHAARLTAEAG